MGKTIGFLITEYTIKKGSEKYPREESHSPGERLGLFFFKEMKMWETV